MNGMYINHKDVHVAAYYVYGNGADTNAYVDEACTVQFTASELTDVFVKGAVIITADGMFRPVSLVVDEGVATINYIEPNASTATSADIAGLVSKADGAE